MTRTLHVSLLALLLLGALSAGACAQVTLDLFFNEADEVLRGAERFDYYGQAATVGDFNGDGIPDVVVGAFLKDGPDGTRADSGMVEVRFGTASGVGTASGSDPSGLRPGVSRIFGANAGDKLGLFLAVGDLNGDGIDDLIASASGIDGPDGTRSEAGGVIVMLGRATATSAFPPVVDLAVTAPDLLVYAPDMDDSRGGAFQFVPVVSADLSGDGIDDLVIGLPGGDGPDGLRDSAGEMHVVLGESSLGGVLDLGQSTAHVVYGEDEGDLLGVAITVGDFDGDERDDLVGGAKNSRGPLNASTRVGEAVGLLASTGLSPVLDLGQKGVEPDFLVYGRDRSDRSSRALAAGDMNGDGIDDLVIGARHADGALDAEESAGDAYVLLGSEGLGGEYFLEVDAALTLFGADRNDSVGYQVAVADVNGDGYGDLITGAQFSDGPDNTRTRAGEIVVVLGDVTLPDVIDLAIESADIHVHGAFGLDSLGTGLGVGDVDADGFADILMGATGRVYKQLDIPSPFADVIEVAEGGALFVQRGAPIMTTLEANPSILAAGESFVLTTRVANLIESSISPRVTISWITPGEDPRVLKQKTIEIGAGQSRRIPRAFPVDAGLPPGTYFLEIRLEDEGAGARFDRDRIPITVVP